MAKLIIMSGVPGSGKSSYVENNKWSGPVVVLSTDNIRKTLTGDASCLDKDEIVWRYIYAILAKPHVNATYIVDATNLVSKRRNSYLKYKNNFESVELIYMHVDVKTAIERNMNRDRKVPENVIRDMIEMAESNADFNKLILDGYDKITIINNI